MTRPPRRRSASRQAGPPSPPAPETAAKAAPVEAPAAPAAEAAPAAAAPPKKAAAAKSAATKSAATKSAAPKKSTEDRSPRKSAGGNRPAASKAGNGRGNKRPENRPAVDPTGRLGTPPKAPASGLRIVALGGIGEIGRNMTVFEHRGKLLIVDCGVLFPEDQQPGVDLILPDFRYIEDRMDDVEAVILTHGHEDHIGALPFLLRLRADIPVIGAKFTLALVAAKCREHRLRPNLVEVVEGNTTTHGPFDCEYFAVNHSIPDALAIAIRTDAGVVLHTGDIKLDQLPLDGRLTDLAGFSRLGDEGVDLFLVDSTNAEVPGFVTPEREIGGVLDNVIGKAKQRVIVASFASHVHRIQQVVDVAARYNRRIVFVGRSMVRNMQIAQD
ncbi:MAG: ribonuclease J, partial [Rhodococcus sp. (in: high G+C Gram-positive bacteria)]|nr:ribonuclease J [Rhodococcus sp. (in: high G+C Gram-positive bacteria)]